MKETNNNILQQLLLSMTDTSINKWRAYWSRTSCRNERRSHFRALSRHWSSTTLRHNVVGFPLVVIRMAPGVTTASCRGWQTIFRQLTHAWRCPQYFPASRVYERKEFSVLLVFQQNLRQTLPIPILVLVRPIQICLSHGASNTRSEYLASVMPQSQVVSERSYTKKYKQDNQANKSSK
jgi:hypothetical protein